MSVSSGRAVLKPTPESLVSRLPTPTSLEETSRPWIKHTTRYGVFIHTTPTVPSFPEAKQDKTDTQGTRTGAYVKDLKRVNQTEGNIKLKLNQTGE